MHYFYCSAFKNLVPRTVHPLFIVRLISAYRPLAVTDRSLSVAGVRAISVIETVDFVSFCFVSYVEKHTT